MLNSYLWHPEASKLSLNSRGQTLQYNQAKTFKSSSLKNFDDPISVESQRKKVEERKYPQKKNNKVFSFNMKLKIVLTMIVKGQQFRTFDGIWG